MTPGQAKQILYAEERREYIDEIARNAVLSGATEAKEKKEYQAEQIPEYGFNGA